MYLEQQQFLKVHVQCIIAYKNTIMVIHSFEIIILDILS